MRSWYLIYRSQTVEELDLVSARSALQKILQTGRVPSALLFAGPKGTGKTSAARIMAKVLNCARQAGAELGEPCNTCDQCLAITNGSHMDVLEIDGASNRGIDDVRQLRESVKLAPSWGRYRVYIIDEVHMLTTEAFNALLKTLEEPPERVVFILCTTELQKVPETIVSRCTLVRFRRAGLAEIVGKLQKVAKAEKLKVDEEALGLLAEAAKGSFRDAVKLLEQASGHQEEKKGLTTQAVQEFLGRTAAADPLKLLGCLATRDEKGSLTEVASAVGAGVDLRRYLEDAVSCLRTELLVKAEVAVEECGQRNDSLQKLTIADLDALVRLLSRAYVELREAVVPQLPLELAVIEWCGVGEASDRSGAEFRKTNQAKDGGGDTEALTKASPVELAPAEPYSLAATPVEGGLAVALEGDNLAVSVEQVAGCWPDVLLKVRPLNHSVEALLRACQPIAVSGGSLVIEVFYKFHKDRLENEKYRRMVEAAIGEVVGVDLKVKYKLGEGKKRPLTDKAHDGPVAEMAGGSGGAVLADDVSGVVVEDEEVIRAASEIFKGAVVE